MKKIVITILILFTYNLVLADSHFLDKNFKQLGLHTDNTVNEISGSFVKGSHVKLFIPTFPYLAISHAINGAMIRPADNDKGYVYDVAVSHTSIDDKIWEFKLRKGVTFQDGTPFNADAVLLNMEYFKKKPLPFARLELYDYTEKIDDYTIRFHLKEPYGMFFNATIYIQFYSKKYLEKFGYNGKETAPNLAEAGKYGLGPYILTEGYIEGDRRSKIAVLKANPNYWGENKPKVETITIYTDLDMDKAVDMISNSESKLDITPILFSNSTDTILSKYAKLTISETTNSYAMHFNMLNGNKAMLDDRIRYVLNHSIDQEYLLNLSMLGEGVASPTMVSPNFYKVDKAIESIQDELVKDNKIDSIENLKNMVITYQKENNLNINEPLKLVFMLPKSLLYIVKDLKFLFKQVHIDLELMIFSGDNDVYSNLLTTYQNKNKISWDISLFGMYDWFKHPWSTFFVYQPFNAWSTIPPNKKLSELTDKITKINIESDEYIPSVAALISYVYKNNLIGFLPNPNNLYAVNKEVYYRAGSASFIYLRDIEVTPYHWSVRGKKPYPIEREQPIKVDRNNNNDN